MFLFFHDTAAHLVQLWHWHTHLKGHLVFRYIAQNEEAFSLCFYRTKAELLCRAEEETTNTHGYSCTDKYINHHHHVSQPSQPSTIIWCYVHLVNFDFAAPKKHKTNKKNLLLYKMHKNDLCFINQNNQNNQVIKCVWCEEMTCWQILPDISG